MPAIDVDDQPTLTQEDSFTYEPAQIAPKDTVAE
jgi:hypothetical protein